MLKLINVRCRASKTTLYHLSDCPRRDSVRSETTYLCLIFRFFRLCIFVICSHIIIPILNYVLFITFQRNLSSKIRINGCKYSHCYLLAVTDDFGQIDTRTLQHSTGNAPSPMFNSTLNENRTISIMSVIHTLIIYSFCMLHNLL